MQKRPNDVLICDICSKEYTRAHKSQHLKSKSCNQFKKLNNAIRELLLAEDNNKPKNIESKLKRPYKDHNDNIIYLTDHQYEWYSKIPNRKYIKL